MATLADVILGATLALSLAVPQLHVDPYQVEVGEQVAIRAARDGAPLRGVEVAVERPDGSRRAAGTTGDDGVLRYVAEGPGGHVARVEVGELRLLAPFHVVAHRSRWLVALVCVPLGLALLWCNLRARRGAGEPGVTSREEPGGTPPGPS